MSKLSVAFAKKTYEVQLRNKYLTGKFAAIIVDKDDPKELLRHKVRIPFLHNNNVAPEHLPWAKPTVQGNSHTGANFFYDPGTWVWVSFENGDPRFPIIDGSFHTNVTPNPNKSEQLGTDKLRSCGGSPVEEAPRSEPGETSAANFVQLQKSPNFKTYSGASSQWGTPAAIDYLVRVTTKWANLHPQATISVGDISLKNGGPMDGHKSHRRGVDIDIDIPGTTDSPYPNTPLTQELVDLFKNEGAAKIFYNDPNINRSFVKVVPGHHNHVHIRVPDSGAAIPVDDRSDYTKQSDCNTDDTAASGTPSNVTAKVDKNNFASTSPHSFLAEVEKTQKLPQGVLSSIAGHYDFGEVNNRVVNSVNNQYNLGPLQTNTSSNPTFLSAGTISTVTPVLTRMDSSRDWIADIEQQWKGIGTIPGAQELVVAAFSQAGGTPGQIASDLRIFSDLNYSAVYTAVLLRVNYRDILRMGLSGDAAWKLAISEMYGVNIDFGDGILADARSRAWKTQKEVSVVANTNSSSSPSNTSVSNTTNNV